MKVIFQKLFPYAPYLNESIGFEDEVGLSESSLQAVERLRKLAEQSHRERYPNLYPNGSESLVTSFEPPYGNVAEVQVEPKETKIDGLIATINYCDKLVFLNKFRGTVEKENDPRLTEAFENKIKQLQ